MSLTEAQKEELTKQIARETATENNVEQILKFNSNPQDFYLGVPQYFSYREQLISLEERLRREQNKTIRAFSSVLSFPNNPWINAFLEKAQRENDQLARRNEQLYSAYSALTLKNLQTQTENQKLRSQSNSFEAIYDRNVIVSQIELLLAQVKYLKDRVRVLENQLDQFDMLSRFEQNLTLKEKT